MRYVPEQPEHHTVAAPNTTHTPTGAFAPVTQSFQPGSGSYGLPGTPRQAGNPGGGLVPGAWGRRGLLPAWSPQPPWLPGLEAGCACDRLRARSMSLPGPVPPG